MKHDIGRAVAVALWFRWFGVILFAAIGAQALAQTPPRDFDHLKTGFPLVGIHAAQRCESCHIDGGFKGTPKDCASCHTSGLRHARSNTVKPPRHIPTQMSCDSCHNAQSFAGARFNHAGVVPGTCASCHNGMTARGKTPGHIVTQASCDSCHKSTTAWSGARMDHSGFTIATNCASCHNGSMATGKPANHIPVAATNCAACHATTGWQPTRFNHTQLVVANQCSICHSGAFPPARGKPNTPVHAGVTACDSCHRSTSNWLAVQFAHSPANAVGTGTCDTCHNGSTAKGKPPTHIPVTTGLARCDSCHRSQTSFATAVTMNHSVVATSTCKSCHNGNYTTQGTVGALAKPGNHIPELQLLNGASMDCNACHVGTASWASVRMNHNASLGGGAGWCKSCHATGTGYLGNMERQALTHKSKIPPAIDCSEAGCHRPLGNRGAPFVSWR